MSKLLNIFISIVFLMSFIGIQINKHYSHGKLYSVALYLDAENCYDEMGACKMDMMGMDHEGHHAQHKCSCENESEIIKLNNVFVSEKFSLPTIISFNLCALTTINTDETKLFFSALPHTTNHFWSPPDDINIQAEFGVFLC